MAERIFYCATNNTDFMEVIVDPDGIEFESQEGESKARVLLSFDAVEELKELLTNILENIGDD